MEKTDESAEVNQNLAKNTRTWIRRRSGCTPASRDPESIASLATWDCFKTSID